MISMMWAAAHDVSAFVVVTCFVVDFGAECWYCPLRKLQGALVVVAAGRLSL
jgi:hypothetical protein